MDAVMREAILRKATESAATTTRFFAANAERIERCARAMAARFAEGARLFAFGNGGSACDAAHLAVELQHPVVEKRRALPALALANDPALLTAIGNDQDFSRIFAAQLDLVARPGDIACGLSTSGASANVNRGLRRARDLSLLTVGFSGRDGGAMADLAEHCFIVESWSIHRIQESHVALLHVLWDCLHLALGEPDVL
jgi:D-sedoheptulose 7-phosphate isomerase